MGMGNRGSDFWAAIFEDQYVVNIGALAEGEGTLCPEIDELATLLKINGTEMRAVIGRIEKDLGSMVRHRGPAIREGQNAVGLGSFKSAGAERADTVGEIGATLSGRHDTSWHTGEWIDPLTPAVWVGPGGRCRRHGNRRYSPSLDRLGADGKDSAMRAAVNGIEIEYETIGDPADVPLLLVIEG
jgi:hypothetical protein